MRRAYVSLMDAPNPESVSESESCSGTRLDVLVSTRGADMTTD